MDKQMDSKAVINLIRNINMNIILIRKRNLDNKHKIKFLVSQRFGHQKIWDIGINQVRNQNYF